MVINFTVEGEPVGWQRAGYNGYTKTIFTQKKTRDQKKQIVMTYLQIARGYMFPPNTEIDLTVIAYFKIPKSTTKTKHGLMESGEVRPTVKPDWDNIGKLVSDALNGVAYDDDKCIVNATVRKYYSERPRTQIIISEADRQEEIEND